MFRGTLARLRRRHPERAEWISPGTGCSLRFNFGTPSPVGRDLKRKTDRDMAVLNWTRRWYKTLPTAGVAPVRIQQCSRSTVAPRPLAVSSGGDGGCTPLAAERVIAGRGRTASPSASTPCVRCVVAPDTDAHALPPMVTGRLEDDSHSAVEHTSQVPLATSGTSAPHMAQTPTCLCPGCDVSGAFITPGA